jgi:hypothetical protein
MPIDHVQLASGQRSRRRNRIGGYAGGHEKLRRAPHPRRRITADLNFVVRQDLHHLGDLLDRGQLRPSGRDHVYRLGEEPRRADADREQIEAAVQVVEEMRQR